MGTSGSEGLHNKTQKQTHTVHVAPAVFDLKKNCHRVGVTGTVFVLKSKACITGGASLCALFSPSQ